MTAPAPSPAEQAVIDRFGIFEPEARVAEEVARAIDEARDAHGPFYFPCKCGWEAGFGAGWEDRGNQHRLLSLAAAAVAAYRAAQDGGAEGETCPCGRGRYIVDHAAWCPPAQDGGAEEAVRDDWLYNEASGVLYGPDPDNPHLRYPFATNVETSVGELIADTMNRAALAPQAGDGAR